MYIYIYMNYIYEYIYIVHMCILAMAQSMWDHLVRENGQGAVPGDRTWHI